MALASSCRKTCTLFWVLDRNNCEAGCPNIFCLCFSYELSVRESPRQSTRFVYAMLFCARGILQRNKTAVASLSNAKCCLVDRPSCLQHARPFQLQIWDIWPIVSLTLRGKTYVKGLAKKRRLHRTQSTKSTDFCLNLCEPIFCSASGYWLLWFLVISLFLGLQPRALWSEYLTFKTPFLVQRQFNCMICWIEIKQKRRKRVPCL